MRITHKQTSTVRISDDEMDLEMKWLPETEEVVFFNHKTGKHFTLTFEEKKALSSFFNQYTKL